LCRPIFLTRCPFIIGDPHMLHGSHVPFCPCPFRYVIPFRDCEVFEVLVISHDSRGTSTAE
jgi:hypothetical protein